MIHFLVNESQANFSIPVEIVSSLIVATVTIIGFVVTSRSMKKSFENELKKQRHDIALDHMARMPFEMLNLMNDMILKGKSNNKNLNVLTKRINENLNTIFSYGSADAIRIAALMQQENYHYMGDLENNEKSKYRIMSQYVLLATQIKYDVTGIAISADEWFMMRINNYDKNRDVIKYEVNKLVKELKLNKYFMIP